MERKVLRIVPVLMLAVTLAVSAVIAEAPEQQTEQGLDEIMPLVNIAEVVNNEGMSLEEMTDAVLESVMSEYLDVTTGFSMQYPSVFLFDENSAGSFAATTDRRATLSVEHMENQGQLTEDMLLEAIRFEIPGATVLINKQNGCIRADRMTDGESMYQTDLYLLTGRYFHHIIMSFPAEEKDLYIRYLEYMINSMATDETDLG